MGKAHDPLAKILRYGADLNSRQFAEVTGLSHSTISRVRRGYPPEYGTLIKLLAWFEKETRPRRRRK